MIPLIYRVSWGFVATQPATAWLKKHAYTILLFCSNTFQAAGCAKQQQLIRRWGECTQFHLESVRFRQRTKGESMGPWPPLLVAEHKKVRVSFNTFDSLRRPNTWWPVYLAS